MLELHEISKSFPGVKSLDRVSLRLERGQVHALVGENGAGKSTLMKIISGAYQADEGKILVDGQPRHWASPEQAKKAGINIIYQEFNLFPNMTVAENIFIGNQPRNRLGLIDVKTRRGMAVAALQRLGHPLDPDRPVSTLSVADRQMVEIAKAIVGETRLLILDEPTAAISGREAELLFERVRELRAAGVAIVFVSHRLDEVTAIADRVSVLKDGVLVGTDAIENMPHQRMISMMVGRELSALYPVKTAQEREADEILRLEHVSAAGRIIDVSLSLKRGEVLGISGLIGAGRTELAHAIFGSLPLSAGRMLLAGKPYAPRNPRDAISAGIGLVTEDRKEEGLFRHGTVAANISAATLGRVSGAFRYDHAAERRIAEEEIRHFSIAVEGPQRYVSGLSGGNQQKALIARWVLAADKVLILDEPTRGVDVGAKAEIYRIIRGLADQGRGILVISSEMQEIIGLCDRVLTMREGEITGELVGAAMTEEAILGLATLARPRTPVVAEA
jgi:ABC-type sugar transport system ATPase subunit